MSEHEQMELPDVPPGAPHDSIVSETAFYVIGLAFALVLSIFWHALDIMWVAIFTIVYLIGTLQ
jgi:hypothetical protein